MRREHLHEQKKQGNRVPNKSLVVPVLLATSRLEDFSSTSSQALTPPSNSLRGGAGAYGQRPPVGRLPTGQGCPSDLVSGLDFRRLSSPILVFEELLKSVIGSL